MISSIVRDSSGRGALYTRGCSSKYGVVKKKKKMNNGDERNRWSDAFK